MHEEENTQGGDTSPKKPKYDNKARMRVRQQCYALAKALNDYFNRKGRGEWDTTSGWAVWLKPGGPDRGYQLGFKRIDDLRSLTRAFWQPHLNPKGQSR